MFHPLAGERIRRDLPGVKLLVLVRDPVERAYSAHAHELARGYETEPFERALELEDQRLAGEAERIVAQPGYLSHSHQHHAYLARGRYADQLERLDKLLGSGGCTSWTAAGSSPILSLSTTECSISSGWGARVSALRAAQRAAPFSMPMPCGRSSASTSSLTTSAWPAGWAARRAGAEPRAAPETV